MTTDPLPALLPCPCGDGAPVYNRSFSSANSSGPSYRVSLFCENCNASVKAAHDIPNQAEANVVTLWNAMCKAEAKAEPVGSEEERIAAIMENKAITAILSEQVGEAEKLVKQAWTDMERWERLFRKSEEENTRLRIDGQRMKDQRDTLAKQVGELQSRVVKLPDRYDIAAYDGMRGMEYEFNPDSDGDWLKAADVLAALKAAGIAWEQT
jgi:hypothetical protein